MNQETLNIKIKVDNSQAITATNSVKKSLTGLGSEGNNSAAGINQLNTSLAQLGVNMRGLQMLQGFSLAKQFKMPVSTKETIEGISGAIRDITQSFKSGGIKGAAGEIGMLKDNFSLLNNAVKNFLASQIWDILLVMAAAVSSLRNAIKVAAIGDTIRDEAQKLQLSTTAYQEWGYVLKQNGVEITSLKTGMRTFNGLVANGSPLLAKYGVTAQNTNEAFEQAIYNIQNLNSEQEKYNALVALFGNRAASELMPVMNMTNAQTKELINTYRAIGGTMSNEMIAKSDRLTDSITMMKSAWQGLRNTLGEAIMPALTRVVQWLTVIFAKISIVIRAILNLKATFGGKNSKSGLAGGSGALASNLGSASKSAKEIRKTLAGFDELELLNGANASGSAGGAGSDAADYDIGGGDFFTSDMLEDISKFQEKIEKIKKLLQILAPILTFVAGLMLIATGHFIAGGALIGISVGLAKVGIFDSITESAREAIKVVGLLAGVVLVAMGLLTGNLVLGIAGVGSIAFALAAGSTQDQKKQEKKRQQAQQQKTYAGAGQTARLNPKAQEIVNNIKQKVTQEWELNKQSVSKIVSDFTSTIKTAGGNVGKWILNVINGAGTLTSNIKLAIGTTWSSLKTQWNNLMANFTDKVVNIKLQIGATITNIKGFINDNIITPLNNKIHKIGLLKNVSIPKLAGGGVLTAPTVAMMGEYAGAKQNPEIVAPQQILMETMDAANSKMVGAFAQMTQQVIRAIEDNQTIVSIGDEQIARSAQRGNQSYKNRTGKPLFSM